MINDQEAYTGGYIVQRNDLCPSHDWTRSCHYTTQNSTQFNLQLDWDIAWLVEYFPSMHNALGFDPQHHINSASWHMPVIPAPRHLRGGEWRIS